MSVWGTEDLHSESEARSNSVKLTKATKLTVLTGAGISAESGIPTFRGPDGLWNDENLMRIATPYGFAEDPKRGWEFYNQRRMNMASAEPNDAHKALFRLEELGYDIVIITQNIDRLHQRAGSKNVIELHGTVWEIKCSNHRCSSNPFANTDVPLSNIPLYCEMCGEHLRPNVVFFEEMLDPDVVEEASVRTKSTDLFMIIGTSGVVYPAAGFAQLAKAYGAALIEFNTERTPLSSLCDESYSGPCGEMLPKVLSEISDGEFVF